MFNILKKEAFGITKRLLNRDFSGNTGLAVKNSIYQFSTNILSKTGSIIFVYLILMRYLSKELFGLYSLALATILIFGGLSDLGIGTALVRYIARDHKKSRGYISYLAEIKTWTTFIVCILLLIGSFLIPKLYQKPELSLALLAGVLYIIFSNISAFFNNIFQAENNFKIPFYREILFQLTRIIFVFLIISSIVSSVGTSESITLFLIFSSLAISYLLLSVFLYFSLPQYPFSRINKNDKKEINKFILPLSVTVLSGIFFGYIDTITLGYYVASEFIADYQAAFSLVTSALAFISFSAVLFPLFSKLNGKKLSLGLKKSLYITIPLSIVLILITWILSPFIFQFVNFITGRDYSNSIFLLQLLSLILFTDPLIGIFTGYHNSLGNTKKVAKAIIISTIINIFLNILFITQILRLTENMYFATWGAAAATIISRFFYLGLLMWRGSKKNS